MPAPADHRVDEYLERLRQELQAVPETEQEVLREVHSHLMFAAEDAAHRGRTIDAVLERFGAVGQIGEELRQVHGRYTWGEIVLALLPLFLLAIDTAAPNVPTWAVSLSLAVPTVWFVAWALWPGRHGPSWGWMWLGCLPLLVPNASPSPMWGALAYLVILLLLRHRDWLEATLALFPLSTVWAFQRTVLASREVQTAGWSDQTVSALVLGIAVVWSGLLARTLRTPSGQTRLSRMLGTLGVVFLLNIVTVGAARLWPTNLFPYPFTLSYFVTFTVPYTLFHGTPYLIFAALTALPAISAVARTRASRQPPSRPVWSG